MQKQKRGEVETRAFGREGEGDEERRGGSVRRKRKDSQSRWKDGKEGREKEARKKEGGRTSERVKGREEGGREDQEEGSHRAEKGNYIGMKKLACGEKSKEA